ncbi:DUF1622 domain-containing protein [Georgenia subflava]|uniref:DUF1622 domain-containing protein n=1 Tax=Georgenia subflava TaxID=1622177 RepID=A0A6N7ECP7_9MICO|nr:DUF1622 domain-containing protein [Georgenia subflava]MPV35869.1 DUF1622 domain-containing protein [Georgenia subflava]
MTGVVASAAVAITAAGVVVALAVAVRAGLRTAIPVLLDFLLAAGLLRLTVDLEWDAIAGTALIVAIRHLITAGLAFGAPPGCAGKDADAGHDRDVAGSRDA